MTESSLKTPGAVPWWQIKMMWLVIAGPVLVVVASFVTLGFALRYPDPVLEHSQNQSGQATSTQTPDTEHTGYKPAMNARNHAATGGK